MRKNTLGAMATVMAVAVIAALPSISIGESSSGTQPLNSALHKTTEPLQAAVDKTVATVKESLQKLGARTKKALAPASAAPPRTAAKPRAPTSTPATDPPLHGTNNHAQGTVGVVDLAPSNERPQGGNPDGSDAGPEDVVAGRARGEQQADGKYHGHITVASLLGNELVGVNSTEGQSNHGPLEPVQTSLLDSLCDGTGKQVCLSVLTADSTTTATGSTNDFAIARAQIGGPTGLGVGAAESQGTISQDANCQTSTGITKTANVNAGGGAVANVANSSSTSKSCRGQAPQVTNTSQVIGLGGTNVPLPAPGCADGTPDTTTGLPPLAPIICNADTIAGATGVREALDVFVLAVGDTALTKETTAASESVSTAPAGGGEQCSDGIDNDGDGLVDAADPDCHTDGNAGNPGSYNPNGPSEGNGGGNNNGGNTGGNNNGSGNGNGNGGNDNGSGNGKTKSINNAGGASPQCSDGIDNDGDGRIDAKDPGCHSDGNAANAASYNPNDNSEASASASTLRSGSLPFTGVDVVQLVLAGLLMLAGGLVLRRREGLLPRR